MSQTGMAKVCWFFLVYDWYKGGKLNALYSYKIIAKKFRQEILVAQTFLCAPVTNGQCQSGRRNSEPS